jgi:hypothetical protein
VQESFVYVTLGIMLAAGFVTDAMGIAALFLHLYIMSSGLKTNVATMAKSWGFLVLPFTTACWQDR